VIAGNFSSANGIARKYIARLNAEGSVDESFVPFHSASWINTIALQADGKIVLGGSVGPGFRGIGRLNPDGSWDSTFDGTADEQIYSTAVQSDGKIIVGGGFKSVNSTGRFGIARLNSDGTLDTDFDPGDGVQGELHSISLQTDGKILVGGLFISIDHFPNSHVARLHADFLPPRLEMISAGDRPVVQLSGDLGQRYVLERAGNLVGEWTLFPEITLTTSPQWIEDSSGGDSQQRFYRARRIQP
jgi:uncharacterized delta-60 repeat protein